jgi:hypothetical protein
VSEANPEVANPVPQTYKAALLQPSRWSAGQPSALLRRRSSISWKQPAAEALLSRVWLCQRSYEHCHCPSHSPLPTRLSNPNQPDEPSSSVGGHSRPQPLPPFSPAHVALAIPASSQDCAHKFCDLVLTGATSPPNRGWTSSTDSSRGSLVHTATRIAFFSASDRNAAFPDGLPNMPALLCLTDNSSATAWANCVTTKSLQGQRLIGIYAGFSPHL